MPNVILINKANEQEEYTGVNTVTLSAADGGTATFISETLIQNQVQSDWTQTDDTQPDYIKNKPEEVALPKISSENDGKILGVLDGKWGLIEVVNGDSLPDVTNDDNGKVLQVVNGVWSSAEAPTSMPEVTMSDNGKIMSVVDGVWAVKTLTIPVELPDVTVSDNGKILKVSDGVWSAGAEMNELPAVSVSDVGKFLRVNSAGEWAAESIANAEDVSF